MISNKTNKCDSSQAVRIISWGGSLKKCCAEHAVQLERIADVIGACYEVQSIDTEDQCYLKENI